MCEMEVGLGFQQFPRTYLVGKKNEEKIFFVSGGSTEIAELNETEKKMMSLLQIDGRMELTKIAKILNVSVGLVHGYYKKLIEKKVLNKTSFTFNHEVIGLKLFRVLLKVAQFDKDRIDTLYNYFIVHPNIFNYVHVMGNWQIFLDIEIESHEKLRDLIDEIKYLFKDIVIQIEIK